MSLAIFAMIQELKAKIAALEARIAALEVKRGPGRPPNESKAA